VTTAVAKSRASLGFTPRLLRRERAAAYLDISPTKFDQLVRAGVLPAAKILDGIRVWDRRDLDAAADALHSDGPPDTTWND
jgi:hypothetical protein